MNETLTLAKLAASLVVGASVTTTVAKVIKAHVVPFTRTEKVQVTVASWVLGAMASKQAVAYTSNRIDKTASDVQAFKDLFAKEETTTTEE